ncbi:hypothetical protein DICVIV_07029 [Dictyocaulus viviparus]|uniref:Uncharacterized protein n=1 Tax=Dictyocaulus viviparus TaxID=29172 RepID=A0A0D8XQH7_DICVI|nr:hypothetical protein DICVIV_07029 [Dictyocaulus viviparus]
MDETTASPSNFRRTQSCRVPQTQFLTHTKLRVKTPESTVLLATKMFASLVVEDRSENNRNIYIHIFISINNMTSLFMLSFESGFFLNHRDYAVDKLYSFT